MRKAGISPQRLVFGSRHGLGVSTEGFPSALLTCEAACSVFVHGPGFARGQSPGLISGAGSTRRARALPVTGPARADTGADWLFLLARKPRSPKPR